EIWQISIDDIKQQPIVGVGMQGLTTSDGTFTQAHNTFLQVAAETGLIGLYLYCRLFILPLQGQRRWRRDALLITFTLAVGGLAENTLRTGIFDYVAWVLLGLLLALK